MSGIQTSSQMTTFPPRPEKKSIAAREMCMHRLESLTNIERALSGCYHDAEHALAEYEEAIKAVREVAKKEISFLQETL